VCGFSNGFAERSSSTTKLFLLENKSISNLGRAIAQAVSRWRPTAAARVRARVWSSGICGGQIGTWVGVLRVLQFPLRNFIPPNSPSSQSAVAG
jgi:hypothetical protein